MYDTNTIEQLIRSVRILTGKRGDRVKLARTLGVLPQRLNDWLSGKQEPSGQTTLALLNWVKAEEQKQKALAVTPPERKTRLKKSSNENPKPSPT
jgi:transcriptional regulator with XRE-family HTH domain